MIKLAVIIAAMIFQSLPAFAASKSAGDRVESPVSMIEGDETPKITKVSVNEVGFGSAEIYAFVEPDADYSDMSGSQRW